MVIGDPYKFAFIIDKVPEWSDDSFRNGIFFVAINGVIFPPEVVTSTLNSDLYTFFEAAPSHLLKMPVDNLFFNMEKNKLFSMLYNSLSSDDVYHGSETCGDVFKFSTTAMEDEGCYCFSISNGETLRVIGAKINLSLDSSDDDWCHHISVSEIKVDTTYMKETVRELKKYYIDELS